MTPGKKPFSLYPRQRKKGRPVYYVQFRLPDGSWGTAKSSGCTSRSEAEAWAINYLQNGQIVHKQNVNLSGFSEDFFSWEGEWATDKRVTGKRISLRQCREKTSILQNRIIPVLGNYKLTNIDKGTIKQFRNNLYKEGLSGSFINKTLSCLKVILESAEEKSLIQFVPKIDRASDKPRSERGILSVEEVKSLFSIEWDDYMAYVMNLTAAVTGLRRGELLALKIKDMHGEYISVSCSWDEATGTLNETTKTGRSRTVIIPGKVREELEQLMAYNPWGRPDSFIFFSTVERKPVEGKYITQQFYKSLKDIGISENQRKERNISFHSHRHWFNSLLINAKIPIQKIQSLTGHLTEKMSEHYYHVHAEELDDVKRIQEGIFIN